jgi:hypothetical protein
LTYIVEGHYKAFIDSDAAEARRGGDAFSEFSDVTPPGL